MIICKNVCEVIYYNNVYICVCAEMRNIWKDFSSFEFKQFSHVEELQTGFHDVAFLPS